MSHLPKDQPILSSSHCKIVAKYINIEICLYLSQIHQPNKIKMPSKLPDNNRLKRLKATEKSVGFSGARRKEYYCRWRSLGLTYREISQSRLSECIVYLHQSQPPGEARSTQSEVWELHTHIQQKSAGDTHPIPTLAERFEQSTECFGHFIFPQCTLPWKAIPLSTRCKGDFLNGLQMKREESCKAVAVQGVKKVSYHCYSAALRGVSHVGGLAPSDALGVSTSLCSVNMCCRLLWYFLECFNTRFIVIEKKQTYHVLWRVQVLFPLSLAGRKAEMTSAKAIQDGQMEHKYSIEGKSELHSLHSDTLQYLKITKGH